MGHSKYVLFVAYNQNGSRIVSGSLDNTIKEWDTATGQCLRSYAGHDKGVSSVVYIGHPDVPAWRSRVG